MRTVIIAISILMSLYGSQQVQADDSCPSWVVTLCSTGNRDYHDVKPANSDDAANKNYKAAGDYVSAHSSSGCGLNMSRVASGNWGVAGCLTQPRKSNSKPHVSQRSSPVAARTTAPSAEDSANSNSAVAKPNGVCTDTKHIDYSKCSFVRFAGAENISGYQKGNQLKRNDTASSAFNEFDVSCGEDSQVTPKVCFGTVECRDVPVRKGGCDSDSPVQESSSVIAKVRVEMSVACSDSKGEGCDTISAAACADPKQNGSQVKSVNIGDVHTRRVGTSDIKSTTETNSGAAH